MMAHFVVLAVCLGEGPHTNPAFAYERRLDRNGKDGIGRR